ncbi:GTP-binding protein [Acuticoccus sediminis]|uniref:GTP-binding protein n=1 Tax=Acuticoccus sediminis TaxID=2184697 RepID=A0A8B2NEY2_9HYPH|nr:GTP-binding protein [Acuticoccus sediminis]RAH97348.1 GTP-binding protein [Acuticoccus sediminis]
MSGADTVPVVLVTGALGAGKTTFINGLLAGDHGRALAAVVNDFGAINIDESLLSAGGRPVYGLKNGCICCSLQGDLLRTIRLVLSIGRPLDGIVIEASGVSDPRGILEALLDPVLGEAIRLDSIVAVVDAEEHDAGDPLWQAQLRLADFVVVSKAEAAGPDAVRALGERLAGMGKQVVFGTSADDGVPPEVLFSGLARDRHLPPRAGDPHRDDGNFVTCEWTAAAPVALDRFQSVIQQLAPALVRAKGLLSVRGRAEGSYVFQLVGRRASLQRAPRPVEGVELVLIGRTGTFDAAAARALLDRELGD